MRRPALPSGGLWLVLLAAVLGACPQAQPSSLSSLVSAEPAPLRWYDRAGKVRFQVPGDWEIEAQPTEDPGVLVLGGHSPDNSCFVLLVSLQGGEVLSEETLLGLAQEKFFAGPKPTRVEEGARLNNLQGRRAELVGTLSGEPIRALVFATKWAGAAYVFIVASREAAAEENLPRLQEIFSSFSGT